MQEYEGDGLWAKVLDLGVSPTIPFEVWVAFLIKSRPYIHLEWCYMVAQPYVFMSRELNRSKISSRDLHVQFADVHPGRGVSSAHSVPRNSQPLSRRHSSGQKLGSPTNDRMYLLTWPSSIRHAPRSA